LTGIYLCRKCRVFHFSACRKFILSDVANYDYVLPWFCMYFYMPEVYDVYIFILFSIIYYWSFVSLFRCWKRLMVSSYYVLDIISLSCSQVYPSAGSVWRFFFTYCIFCISCILYTGCVLWFTYLLVVFFFCRSYYCIYFIIQLLWFCRHLHLPEVWDAFFFIISLIKLSNFCGFAGISICQKCVMLSSSVFFLILSWFFLQEYSSAGSVGRFFYILVVSYSCRS